jgi:hypothetical protein
MGKFHLILFCGNPISISRKHRHPQKSAERPAYCLEGLQMRPKPLYPWAILDFCWPGKPTDNAFIEAFNSRFRQDCLNEPWFLSLKDATENRGLA